MGNQLILPPIRRKAAEWFRITFAFVALYKVPSFKLLQNFFIEQKRMWQKTLLTAATAAFLMLTLLSLMEDRFALIAYRLVLVAYSATMIGVELLEREMDGEEKTLTKVSRAVAVLGYATFIEAAYLYHTFNQGDIYIVGSFLITTAALLKVFALALDSVLNSKKMFKTPYNLIRTSSLAGVGLFFFITSISQGLKLSCFYTALLLLGKGCNVLAAGLHVIAVFNLHKEEQIKHLQKIRYAESDGNLL